MKKSLFILLFILPFHLFAQQGNITVTYAGASNYPKLRLSEINGYFNLSDNDSIYYNNLDSVIVDDNSSIKYFCVKSNGKWGLITENNHVGIPVEFDKIKRAFNTYYYVFGNNKTGLYDRIKGEIIPCVYDNIEFSKLVGAEFIVRKESKWGIYDTKGKEVAPPIYDKAAAYYFTIEMRKDDRNYYFIDNKVVELDSIDVQKSFDSKSDHPSDSKRFFKTLKNGKWGLLDEKVNFVIQPSFEDFKYIKPLDLLFALQNGKWGIMNLKNEIIEEPRFDAIDLYNSEILIVQSGNIKQLYNIGLRKILPEPVFERIRWCDTSYCVISMDGKETLFDSNNLKMLFPYNYEEVQPMENGLISFKTGDKVGVMDIYENVKMPPLYDRLYMVDDLIFVQQNNKWGALTTDYKTLIPIEYDILNSRKHLGYIEATESITYSPDTVIYFDYNGEPIQNIER